MPEPIMIASKSFGTALETKPCRLSPTLAGLSCSGDVTQNIIRKTTITNIAKLQCRIVTAFKWGDIESIAYCPTLVRETRLALGINRSGLMYMIQDSLRFTVL
eukprot:928688_1